MQFRDVVPYLIDTSKVSMYALSGLLHKNRNYVVNLRAKRPDPRLSTVVGVADLVGVDVALVDRATGVTLATIEPPTAPGPE